MATKSKFFRVVTEGDTTDGRVVQRSWIEQMAKNFNREKYGARVWLEHLRGILPDSFFKAYGDVLAVKAEEVEMDGQKKLALFAQIDPTADLVAMNKARQKIYTSAEINPNFAKSGEAYLVGLAVTDSPASLGTEILQFAAGAQVNPLAIRKQNPENLFSAAHEVTLEFEEQEDKPGLGEILLTKVKELLGKDKKDNDANLANTAQAVETIALSQKETLEALDKVSKDFAAVQVEVKKLTDAQATAAQEFASFKEQLDQEPAGGQTRPPAAGGNGTIKTDC